MRFVWVNGGILLLRLILVALLFLGPSALCNAEDGSASGLINGFEFLDEVHGAAAENWVLQQNNRTIETLSHNPDYSNNRSIAGQLLELESTQSAALSLGGSTIIRGGWVHEVKQDEQHQRGIWRRTRLASYLGGHPDWNELLDLDRLSSQEGRNWIMVLPGMKCLPPSFDRCMVQLSDGGRDQSEYREFDISTQKFVRNGYDTKERVRAVAWESANSILFSDHTSVSNPPTVRRWQRGQPLEQAEVVFRGSADDLDVIPELLSANRGASVLIVSEYRKDRTVFVWQLRKGRWVLQRTPHDAHLVGLFDNKLLFSLLADWLDGSDRWRAGSVVAVSLHSPAIKETLVSPIMVPDASEAIFAVNATSSGVLISYTQNVNGRLALFLPKPKGWLKRQIKLPDYGKLEIVAAAPGEHTAIVRFQSFLVPPVIFAIDCRTGIARQVVSAISEFDAAQYVTEQLWAVSKDGTKVPYYLVRSKRAKYTGNTPALIYAYGGFNDPQRPTYSGFLGRLWLDRGGAYVLANIRGGGEFGPSWWNAARGLRRQNSYDDFEAVALDLIRRKITSPGLIAMHGVSNGGLLVGVVLNQRPELFGAAVAEVGPLDLESYLQSHPGNVHEYGSLDSPAEAAFIAQESPYQNLVSRPGMPAPFIITSTTDSNVPPIYSRKYAAKLEKLGLAFFFYETAEGGHNVWSTPRERLDYEALFYTYLSMKLMPVNNPH